jgi:hypothetical protein
LREKEFGKKDILTRGEVIRIPTGSFVPHHSKVTKEKRL